MRWIAVEARRNWCGLGSTVEFLREFEHVTLFVHTWRPQNKHQNCPIFAVQYRRRRRL